MANSIEATVPAACAAFGIAAPSSVRRCTGGELNDVFRAVTPSGEFAVRFGHVDATEAATEYELLLMNHMAEAIVVVPAPVRAPDNRPSRRIAGRVVSVFPFRPGSKGPARDAGYRQQAAVVLAQTHRRSLDFGSAARPGFAPVRDLDLDRQPAVTGALTSVQRRHWEWPYTIDALRRSDAVERAFAGVERFRPATFSPLVDAVERQRLESSGFLEALVRSERELHFAPVHGDFWPGNVLWDGRQITAVIDWDECRPDWLVFELARSAWEFSKSEGAGERTAAKAFIETYRAAGGPVGERDDDLIEPLIQLNLLVETLWALTEAMSPEPWSHRYPRSEQAEWALLQAQRLAHMATR